MKKIFTTLAICLLFGSALSTSMHKTSPIETKAATIQAQTRFYLIPNANWNVDGARFATYFYNSDSDNAWVSMSLVSGESNVYTALSPADRTFSKLIICRMNPANTTNGWDNKWNQTGNLTWDGSRNLFEVPSGAWDGSTVDWRYYVDATTRSNNFVTTTEGITSAKTRIWLDRSGHWENGAIYYLLIDGYYYVPTGYTTAKGTQYFAFYDMLLSDLLGKNIQVVVAKSDKTMIYDIAASQVFTAGDSSKLWKISTSSGFTYSKTAVSGTVYGTWLAKVLDGYLTCESSVNNGYLASPMIWDNFIYRGEWNTSGDIGGNTISDYTGVGSSGYDNLENKTGSVDAWVKYQMMQALYTLSEGSGRQYSPESTTNTVMGTVLVGVIGLTSIIGYFFLNKKKVFVK